MHKERIKDENYQPEVISGQYLDESITILTSVANRIGYRIEIVAQPGEPYTHVSASPECDSRVVHQGVVSPGFKYIKIIGNPNTNFSDFWKQVGEEKALASARAQNS